MKNNLMKSLPMMLIAMISANLLTNSNATADLITRHYWDFNSASTPYNDLVGTAHGTVTAGTTVTVNSAGATPPGGNALRTVATYVGTNSSALASANRVNIPGASLFNIGGNAFSASGWFRMPTALSQSRGIIDFSGNGGNGLHLAYNGNTNQLAGRIDGGFTTSTSDSIVANSSTLALQNNVWHSFAVNFDPAGATANDRLQIFLNGSLISTTNTQSGGALGAFTFATSDVSIGWLNIANNLGLGGDVDDVALYSDNLSLAQVSALHSGAATPLTVAAIPEPSSALMIGLVGMSLSLIRRRNR